ncbi:hypothetical protein [Enterovirga sp.]|jgi:hypothetical protein|uniref:hypothetical protein n=1 Tax=Enterovirga sp. TaxID=2026350 RepID=UPI0026165C2D|nr:hypothetical protein [Enterovirga sp.]MDB5591664.1 hypothetical protein [Enterovirga sp.]
MRKAILLAAVLGTLAFPAAAQQSTTGQSSGGYARVGGPGQITGHRMTRPRMMKHRMTRQRMMRQRMMKRHMMRRQATRRRAM